MKYLEAVKSIIKKDVLFYIFSITSIGLIITSFFIPPTGVIDPSVFAGVGEIFAFAGLYEIHRAIDKGVDASITHNSTTIQIQNDERENELLDT